MKKTFIFDVDGTLFNSKSKILRETIKAIQLITKNGNEFILASGRACSSLIAIAQTLPVKPRFLIGGNGSCIYDYESKNVIKQSIVNNAFIRDFLSYEELAKQNVVIQMQDKSLSYNLDDEFIDKLVNKGDCFYTGGLNKISKKQFQNLMNIPYLELHGWHQKGAWPKYKELIKNLTSKYNLSFNDIEFYGFITIFVSGDSKGKAIKYLQKSKRIDKDNCYAFGDGDNDVEMFQNVKHSYAMGQAKKIVKSKALNIIGTNDKPSIYNVILKILNV